MTTARLSTILLGKRTTDDDKRIVPNDIWCDLTEGWLDDAWRDADRLKKQRDELTELLPHNREKYASQCSDAVYKVAARLMDSLECGTHL